MDTPFGHSISFAFAPTRRWLSLGPAWAAVAGVLASGYANLDLTGLLMLITLWILVDPLLGTLWDLAVDHGLVRRITRAELPVPPQTGIDLPYAQPGSLAGGLVSLIRRYKLWWQNHYWPEHKRYVTSFWVVLVVALFIGLALNRTVFWIVVLAATLTILAGLNPSDLRDSGGGRLQSVVQFLLPWAMGAALWANLSLPSLALGVAYWLVYLGGLRMLGEHRRAEWLFYLGQLAAIILLLGLSLLPGAVVLSTLLMAQLLVRTKYTSATILLQKSQLYLVIGLLVAGVSTGSL
jgi:hypothetical protein